MHNFSSLFLSYYIKGMLGTLTESVFLAVENLLLTLNDVYLNSLVKMGIFHFPESLCRPRGHKTFFIPGLQIRVLLFV